MKGNREKVIIIKIKKKRKDTWCKVIQRTGVLSDVGGIVHNWAWRIWVSHFRDSRSLPPPQPSLIPIHMVISFANFSSEYPQSATRSNS